MITAMVRSVLASDTGVAALVGTRVYVDALPVGVTLPAISVHPISDPPDPNASNGGTARVQASCWSNPPLSNGVRSPAEVESVAAAVKAVMHKPRLNNAVVRWTVGSVSYDIVSRTVTGGVRLIDPITDWYHKPVDVLIRYNKV